MTRFVAVLLTVGSVLLLAPAARALDPLPLSAVSPADGAFVPPTPTGGIPWQFTVAGPPPDANVSVTISTSPTTGPDGTLPTDNRVDFFFLTADPAAPTVFAGRSDPGPNAWSAALGTYYWQALATWTDAGGVFHSAGSKIERVVIGTPPPAAPTPPPSLPAASRRATLAMSSLDATFYVRAVIRLRTRRQPVRLRYGCRRLNSRSFRCRPTWRDRRNVYSATATFTHARSGQRIVARATVSGLRASRTCTSRRSVRSCGRRFNWRATVAARPIPRSSATGVGYARPQLER